MEAAARLAGESSTAQELTPEFVAFSTIVAIATVKVPPFAVIFTASLRAALPAAVVSLLRLAEVSVMLYTTALVKAEIVLAWAKVASVVAVTVPARVSTALLLPDKLSAVSAML